MVIIKLIVLTLKKTRFAPICTQHLSHKEQNNNHFKFLYSFYFILLAVKD